MANYHVDATVKDIDDAVKIEMQSAAFIDTPNLIDDMFGFQTGALELILERLVAQGSYVYKSGVNPSHWRDLPLDPQTEGVLYTPLTQILNDITAACRPDWRNPTTLPNEPPTSPASAGPLFSHLHPSTASSSAVLSTATAPDPLSDPRGLLSTPPLDIVWSDEHSKSPKSPDPFISLMRPDIVASFRASQVDAAVWWRTVHIPLEVKRPSDAHAAAVQLLRYVRQALHVQHDRRFMYGLVFARRSLALWHVDRSGALASEVFDVHENPMKFIQIIAGLMYMDPVQLGWDPTMKMYVKDKCGNFLEPPRFSYEITPTKENTIKQYETAWLVSMNKPGTKHEIEEFVLWRALSLGRSEVIKGRATRVWCAWLKSEMHLPPLDRHLYVFKDMWQDAERPTEGSLYLKANKGKGGPGVAAMHSYGFVLINGQQDDTLVFIRRSVRHKGNPIMLLTPQNPDRAGARRDPNDMKEFPVTGWDKDRFKETLSASVPRNRVHSRTVMSSFGWPLLKFRDLAELGGALHDAIAGHKWLYDQGILHRDISPGNVLITGRGAPNRGILIDLDNACEYKSHVSIPDDPRSVGTLAFMSSEVISKRPYFMIPQQSASRSSQMPSSEQVGSTPSSSSSHTQAAPFRHHFCHDLESFFWALCWMGICRQGPGQYRIIWPEDPHAREVLDSLISDLFEEEALSKIAAQKRVYMLDPGYFRDSVLSAFTPYFEALRDTVDSLYESVRAAYQTRDFTTLYASFLGALDKLVEEHADWNNTNDAFRLMAQGVDDKRKEAQVRWDSPHKSRFHALTEHKRERDESGDGSETLAEGEEGGSPKAIAGLLPHPSSPTPTQPNKRRITAIGESEEDVEMDHSD